MGKNIVKELFIHENYLGLNPNIYNGFRRKCIRDSFKSVCESEFISVIGICVFFGEKQLA